MKVLLVAILICVVFAQPRSFTRSKQFDFQRLIRIPRGVTPLCGTYSKCASIPKFYFNIPIEGVKNTVNLKRVLADSTFEIHQADDCSGTTDITFNNRYVLRYKRIDVQNHTRFVMHMIGLNATVNTENGVQHLKNLLTKYCPLLEVTTGNEINIMRQCRRFAFREFHAHFAGSYYLKDGKTYITLIDPFTTPNSAEPVEFQPIECPTLPNESDSPAGGINNNNVQATAAPNALSQGTVAPTTVAPTTAGEKKDGEEKPTTPSPSSVAPTTAAPTTVAPTTPTPTTPAPTKA